MRLTMGLIGWLVVASAARADSVAPSPRPSRGPIAVSVAANAMMPSLGVDVSYRFVERFALAAQLTTLLILHTDVSVRSRLFLFSWSSGALYCGANVHGWYSPMVLKVPTGMVTLELGGEWYTGGDWTIGLGAGGGLLRVPDHVDVDPPKPRWSRLPLLNLRVGRRW